MLLSLSFTGEKRIARDIWLFSSSNVHLFSVAAAMFALSRCIVVEWRVSGRGVWGWKKKNCGKGREVWFKTVQKK